METFCREKSGGFFGGPFGLRLRPRLRSRFPHSVGTTGKSVPLPEFTGSPETSGTKTRLTIHKTACSHVVNRPFQLPHFIFWTKLRRGLPHRRWSEHSKPLASFRRGRKATLIAQVWHLLSCLRGLPHRRWSKHSKPLASFSRGRKTILFAQVRQLVSCRHELPHRRWSKHSKPLASFSRGRKTILFAQVRQLVSCRHELPHRRWSKHSKPLASFSRGRKTVLFAQVWQLLSCLRELPHRRWSAQETFHDFLFRFLFGKPQSAKLHDLLSRDFSNGCFVNQRGVPIVGGKLRGSIYSALVRDDGITFRMSRTRGVPQSWTW